MPMRSATCSRLRPDPSIPRSIVWRTPRSIEARSKVSITVAVKDCCEICIALIPRFVMLNLRKVSVPLAHAYNVHGNHAKVKNKKDRHRGSVTFSRKRNFPFAEGASAEPGRVRGRGRSCSARRFYMGEAGPPFYALSRRVCGVGEASIEAQTPRRGALVLGADRTWSIRIALSGPRDR